MMFTFFWFSLALLQKSTCSDSFSALPSENIVVEDSSFPSLKEASDAGETSSEGGEEALLKFSDISNLTSIAPDEPECNNTEGCQLSLSTVSGASTVVIPKMTSNIDSSVKINAVTQHVQPDNSSTTVVPTHLPKHQDRSTGMSHPYQTLPSILEGLHYGGNELDSEVKAVSEYSTSTNQDRTAGPSVEFSAQLNSESSGTVSAVISEESTLIANEKNTESLANVSNELISADIATESYNPSTTPTNSIVVSSPEGSEQYNRETIVLVNYSTTSNVDLITSKVPVDLESLSDSGLNMHSMNLGSVSSLSTITSSHSETEHGAVTKDVKHATQNYLGYPVLNSSTELHSEDLENLTSAPNNKVTELPSQWLTVSTILSETLPPDIALNASSFTDYSNFLSHIATIPDVHVPSSVSLSERYTSTADSTSGIHFLSTSTMSSGAPEDNGSHLSTVVYPSVTDVGTHLGIDSQPTKPSETNDDRNDMELNNTLGSIPNTLSFSESQSTTANLFVTLTKDASLKPTEIFLEPSTLQGDLALPIASQIPDIFTSSQGDPFMYKENVLDNDKQSILSQLSTDSFYVSNQEENGSHFGPTEPNFTLPSATDVPHSSAATLILNSAHTKAVTAFFSGTIEPRDTAATTSGVELKSSNAIPSSFSSIVDITGGSPTSTSSSEVSESQSLSPSTWTSTLSQNSTETHREGKHIPFSSPSTGIETSSTGVISVTDASEIETVDNISEVFSRRLHYEDLTPADKANVITAVILLPSSHLHKDLDSNICKVHNWLQHVLTKEFRNWTKDPFQDDSTEEFERVPFGNVSVFYILPTPDFNSSHITLTFIVYNIWRNDTLPVDFVLTILNFYSKGLKESMNASSVRFSHGFPSESYDLLLTILDKYGVMVFTVGLAVVGVLLLMCLVVLYRRRNRHSIHHLTDGKLQYGVHEGTGIDLTPASVILEDEKGGKKMCDDEGWLVPIHQVPAAEEINVPNVQDTKL